MSFGLGEWERGIPCMLPGSQGGRPGWTIGLAWEVPSASCCPLLAAGPCSQRALSPGSLGREWGAVAFVYSACFNLGSQG